MKRSATYKNWVHLIIVGTVSAFIVSCWINTKSNVSCYIVKNEEVFLRYYGGYPTAKEVLLKVKEADPNTFQFIEGSRSGACQKGHMFAKDEKHVFYRTDITEQANTDSFEVLKYGYSKDQNSVFYKANILPQADLETFFVIENERKLPYSADKNGLIIKEKRINAMLDAHSFELLPRPYSKDKNHVYFGDDFQILDHANPTTFVCPEFNSIVNYQYYAFDISRAFYYENGQISIIENIDAKTFKVLSTHYAKDKNNVYYKSQIIAGADIESFHIPIKMNHRTAKDKTHTYFEGTIKEN